MCIRDRLEDIPLLVAEFSTRLFRRGGVPKRAFSPAAMSAFMRHSWPGNVRELENVVERSLTLASGESVGAEDLSLASSFRDDSIPDPHEGFSMPDYLKRTETHLVRRAMEISEGRRADAARILGLSERSLKYLLAKTSPE